MKQSDVYHPMLYKIIKLTVFLSFLFLSFGAVQSKTFSPQNTNHLEEYGKGKYGQFYVLRDPKTKKPLSHVAYNLKDPKSKFYVEGKTDKKGRTKFIHHSNKNLLKRLQVSRTVGFGGNSGGFVVVYEGTKIPVQERKYVITNSKGKVLWKGITDENGNTVIVKSKKPETIHISVYDMDTGHKRYRSKKMGK